MICLLALLTDSGKMMAQDTLRNPHDTLGVYNLFVSLNSVADTNIARRHNHSKDTLMNLNVGFKVNFPGSVDELFILIGSEKDSSDYKLVVLSVEKEKGDNSIYYKNKKISKFWKRDVSYSFTFPTLDISHVKWVTVYAKDKHGRFSKRDYFNIQ